MNNEDLSRQIKKLVREATTEGGMHLINGSTTQNGHFYGFTINSAPETLKLTVEDNSQINGEFISDSDNIIDYFGIGQFYPVRFSSITIDSATGATGSIVLYKY